MPQLQSILNKLYFFYAAVFILNCAFFILEIIIPNDREFGTGFIFGTTFFSTIYFLSAFLWTRYLKQNIIEIDNDTKRKYHLRLYASYCLIPLLFILIYLISVVHYISLVQNPWVLNFWIILFFWFNFFKNFGAPKQSRQWSKKFFHY